VNNPNLVPPQPMRVLIAEDDASLLRALAAAVSSFGFDVVVAENGRVAWELYIQMPFPIVLTDWLMPGMDGMELIRAIRNFDAENYSYIIMLTGASDSSAFKKGMTAGADDMLIKPWSGDELFARLTVARRIMKLGQELAETNRVLRRSNQELEFFRERVTRELDAAAKVQESLLPGTLTVIPGFKVAWNLVACEELAGDVLNIFQLDEHRFGLYVLDVCGHGVSAALLSAQLSRLLNPDLTQSQLLRRPANGSGVPEIVKPSQVMRELNVMFQMDPTEPQFFTLIYGVLDVEKHELVFCSAGHPGPILVPKGENAGVVVVSGTPIGLLSEGSWTDEVLRINEGDRVVLFSDGLMEATNGGGEMFGDRRLLEIIEMGRTNPVGTCCGTIMESLEAWTGTNHLQDDCSLLMLSAE
jgi:sigma-B regulation protein RsbU (phosphoserine phosphatase)